MGGELFADTTVSVGGTRVENNSVGTTSKVEIGVEVSVGVDGGPDEIVAISVGDPEETITDVVAVGKEDVGCKLVEFCEQPIHNKLTIIPTKKTLYMRFYIKAGWLSIPLRP